MRPIPLTFAALGLAAALIFRRRLGWRLVAVLLAIVAVLAVYGSGVIELPTVEEVVESVGSTLGGWTYLAVGILAFLEAAAFAGLVVPGEFAVIFGGIIAGRGDIALLPLIAVVWFSAFTGDLAGYAFGRKVGREWALRHGRRFGVTEKRLAWAEEYFARHGGKTIILGRFVGFVRALAPFIAGTSRMPIKKFLFADAIGGGLWAATFCILGYVFWRSLDRALELARTGKLGLGVVLLLAAIVFAGYRLLHDRESRRRTASWVREHVPFATRWLGSPGADAGSDHP